jgi:transcriptional regulator with XRE-family HTH domain
MPKMGTKQLARTELRNTLFRLRDSRGLTMARMADLLSTKGLTVYATTIAKIESGSRAVQIDELVAYAEIFDVSIDMLLGHTSTGAGDKSALVRKLLDQLERSLWVIQSSRVALSDAASDLDGYDLTPAESLLHLGTEVVCAALADACNAIPTTTQVVARQENKK